MEHLLTYNEALSKIENFMISTGIRKFCSDSCKGKCCLGCYDSEKSCVKNEGRRLSCSIWVCNEMLNLVFNDRDKLRMTILKDKIEQILEYWMPKNIYLNPHDKKYVIDKFKINEKFVDLINLIDIKNVKSKVISLTTITRWVKND